MSYITYFDLLGTRGFCDDSEAYYNNLLRFNRAVCQTGAILLDYGQVGVFSDSAYAESSKLSVLLQFLTLLRNRLLADGLFFNAVVKRGSLGIKSVSEHTKNVLVLLSKIRKSLTFILPRPILRVWVYLLISL